MSATAPPSPQASQATPLLSDAALADLHAVAIAITPSPTPAVSPKTPRARAATNPKTTRSAGHNAPAAAV